MLLDIAEPGQSLAPHQEDPLKKRVVGIDLGTTFSLVAAMTEGGQPACIPDEQGQVSLPSIVHYGAGEPLVGHAARERAISHPQDTISSVKRFMGRSLKDLTGQEGQTPYRLSDGEGGMVRIEAGGEERSPVSVSAEILKALKERAEEALGGPLEGAVITVPAYFDDAQRQATKDAGKLAGLNVMRLVNEPTAAALAYGLDQGAEGVYAIYDLGGGTFDVSILKLTKGVFQVLSTGGDSALGGDDFDHALARHWLGEAGLDGGDASTLKAALKAARTAKELLSQTEQAEVTLEIPGVAPRRQHITRAAFEAMIQGLVRKTGLPCRRALKDAGVTAESLQGVVLVGGSTRVPLVYQFVAELFGRQPLTDLDPDQVVALGAAHQADLLGGSRRSDLLLLDVIPLSLGLETMGNLVEKIVPRNSTIPTARAQEFTTFKDGQTAMAVHVVQGERELADQCRSLARFELRGIPPMVAGAARIRVTFQVDADGLLTVHAREETTGISQRVEVKPSYGLSDGEIEHMLRDALAHTEDDVKARLLAEARVEAERVLHAISSALKQDMDLLSPEEVKAINRQMRLLWESTRKDDHEVINAEIARLDQATQVFAQRRMDQGVRAAMAGRSLSAFE